MKYENNKLVLERFCDAPIELVWKSLTDINLLKQWLPFFPEFKAEVGFETTFKLGPDENHQYLHHCKVLEVIPGKKLTYTWFYEEDEGRSEVTFELEEKGEETKIVLTHHIIKLFSDNPDLSNKNFAAGWNYTIEGLKEFAEKEYQDSGQAGMTRGEVSR